MVSSLSLLWSCVGCTTVNELCMNHSQLSPSIPKNCQINRLILWSYLAMVGIGNVWHCPHNPKVAGSNPAPATPLKGLEAMASRAFNFCSVFPHIRKIPVLTPF
jgi:hypothetical protein